MPQIDVLCMYVNFLRQNVRTLRKSYLFGQMSGITSYVKILSIVVQFVLVLEKHTYRMRRIYNFIVVNHVATSSVNVSLLMQYKLYRPTHSTQNKSSYESVFY